MKIFSVEQIREWDAYTIEKEPIKSVALMDRAAAAVAEWIIANWTGPVIIIAGTGNNGGDGLALARILHFSFFEVKVWVCRFSEKASPDFQAQIRALPPFDAVPVQIFRPKSQLPTDIPANALIVDALFGTGLDRPLENPWIKVVNWINGLPNTVLAIDMPSGLLADKYTQGPCVQANYTLTFQKPKLAFFLPGNAIFTGKWTVVDIGLHPEYEIQTDSLLHMTTLPDILKIIKPRERFSHKGTFGHALLIVGSYGKIGAAVLAAKACLRAGVGLLTVHGPRCANLVLQTAVPEAMFYPSNRGKLIDNIPDELDHYSAIAIGPGIGQDIHTAQALESLLKTVKKPLVLDADALNILSENLEWWQYMPKNSILTPHPKEFDRLFGESSNPFERLERLRQAALELGIFIVLKGAYSAIAFPNGQCYFNSTGNPGMATGGTGDVLTGILAGLLAQGYSSAEVCLIGVYLHGLAGDIYVQNNGGPALIAGDITDYLGSAWKQLGT